MLKLDNTLSAWGTLNFETILKQELTQQADQLPLQRGLATSSYVTDAPITVVMQHIAELENSIHIKAGIFYQGVIAGCSCADDPTPISENTEYCEVQLDIDKKSAVTTVELVGDK